MPTTKWLGTALTVALVAQGCMKRKTGVKEITPPNFKTGSMRDDGTHGKDAFIENSAFEEPTSNVSRPAETQDTALVPTKPELPKPADSSTATTEPTPQTTPTQPPPIPTTTPTTPKPVPAPTTPTADTGGKDKPAPTPPAPAPAPSNPTPPSQTPPPSTVLTKLPVRRVCSDWAVKKHGFAASTMSPDDLMIRLFPISSQSPIVTLEADRRAILAEIINSGSVTLDFSKVPDGAYNLAFCHAKGTCRETELMADHGDLEKFQRYYRWELDKEYEAEKSRGIVGFTDRFASRNNSYHEYREGIVLDRAGVFGGAVRVIVEQGRAAFPATSPLVRGNGVVYIQSQPHAQRFDPIIAPQVLVLYRANKDRTPRTSLLGGTTPTPPPATPTTPTTPSKNPPQPPKYPPTPIPSPDHCDDTASPLMLDFANAGVRLGAPLEGVSFDLDADGAMDRVSWPLSPDTAFIVLDVNGNGAIDNGGELFGNHTLLPSKEKAPNGFEGLAQYDANGDKKIDAKDEVYAKLRLWFDRNRNGKAEKDELETLNARRLRAIDLRYEDMYEEDEYANETRQRSVVEMSDGVVRMIFDIWLRVL